MISIILASRDRYVPLRSALASLMNTASAPDQIEIIVRADDDDHVGIEELVGMFPNMRVIRGPRYGYAGLQNYYNELAAQSKGKYIVLWNDDAQMISKGWDVALQSAPPFSIQWPRDRHVSTSEQTFPIVDRDVYLAMGYMCGHAYYDVWLSHVGADLGITVIRDDIVFNHDRLSDGLSRQKGPDMSQQYHSEAFQSRRREVVENVRSCQLWSSRVL